MVLDSIFPDDSPRGFACLLFCRQELTRRIELGHRDTWFWKLKMKSVDYLIHAIQRSTTRDLSTDLIELSDEEKDSVLCNHFLLRGRQSDQNFSAAKYNKDWLLSMQKRARKYVTARRNSQ